MIDSDIQTNSIDRFRRLRILLGDEACERLTGSLVMVVGLGAVGSYATEGLARAGVGRLRLVDFDTVGLTNINRQLYALESTLGRPKCEVALERVLDINPSCKVEAIRGFVDSVSINEYLADKPDLVIDAIDSLNPKVDLITAVRTAGIPIISCLGAAMRFDPTCVRTGPISQSNGCPLGRAVRKRLRRRGVPLDFPCVYSEEPLPNPLPRIAPVERLAEETPFERGRTRDILGSMPTITGIFGLTAANLAIRTLTQR
ncbi:MAG TPA: tRNA threonylcarbamoyladenosine dehydratase [Armatimonadota bacterium]|jgi:tRNA A37 threonylcarbamoyladenosine dehydratase